jgi:hypothetical protein
VPFREAESDAGSLWNSDAESSYAGSEYQGSEAGDSDAEDGSDAGDGEDVGGGGDVGGGLTGSKSNEFSYGKQLPSFMR